MLQKLILVNKFSFMALVPVIYCNPLSDWSNEHKSRLEHNTNNRNFTLKPEKLAELFLASVIHFQREAVQPQPLDAAKFLEQYGLYRQDHIESPLLQNAVQGVSPTTVDYSRYLTTQQQWPRNDLLCVLKRGCSGPDLAHRQPYQSHGDDVAERFYNLLVQSRPEAIVTLSISIPNSSKFVSLADKMPKLRTVRLGNRGTYPEEYTDDIIALLRAHRAAFPGKCPVCIEFPEDAVAHNIQYGSNLFGGGVGSLLKQEHFPRKEKFRVILYEAVGNPSEMDASDCPNFYDMTGNIGLGHLV
ncbi:hypothetical protein BGZ81_008544, partial [Podila clonocystis]